MHKKENHKKIIEKHQRYLRTFQSEIRKNLRTSQPQKKIYWSLLKKKECNALKACN